jgi:hypothetical protein
MRKLTDHIVEGDSANHQLEVQVRDEPGAGRANHRYEITGFNTGTNPSEAKGVPPWERAVVLFQNGPIKEFGVNGVTHEALLAIIIDRLSAFQRGPFPSDETQGALEHCTTALEYLKRRISERMARGVEGTHQR